MLGIGIAFVMSPMSTAGMNAVDRTKAGVASGVLSMSRMVGGSFGIAAMGALIIGVGRHKLDQLLPALPAGKREQLAEALGSGGAAGGGRIAGAVNEAFVTAIGTGLKLSAAVAAAGAVLCWLLIAREPEQAPVPADAQAQAAAPAGVEPHGEPVRV
jgi:hypothetical protein